MYEHTFDCDRDRYRAEDAGVTAAELAELLLDEVSAAERDWRSIGHHAQALARVAELAAAKASKTALEPDLPMCRATPPEDAGAGP